MEFKDVFQYSTNIHGKNDWNMVSCKIIVIINPSFLSSKIGENKWRI
jgi:hypothetical protein